MKQQPATVGGSSIESEHEFIEIGLEPMMADGTLVGAKQPALQQGGHSVDVWEQVLAHLLGVARDRVPIAAFRQPYIAAESVRDYLLPGSTRSSTVLINVTAVASGITTSRIRPMRTPLISVAIKTKDLPAAPRPRLPVLTPPMKVSSTSTSPVSFVRDGTTAARRMRCIHSQLVW